MQLFNNLLENSLRYTDSGGGLHISGKHGNGRFALTFADSAPGVQDTQLERLFERFYRTEGSRNRASGGSGWGWRFASTSSRPITAQSAPPIRLLAGLALQ
jgi:two-component system sensor histidine kinase BaeS